MQSKAKAKGYRRRKSTLLLLVVVLVGGFAYAMMHEPKLVQAPVEQALDASQFKQ